MSQKHREHNLPIYRSLDEVPKTGYSRPKQVATVFPVSLGTIRNLQLKNKAPKTIKMGERVALFSNEEIHKFCSDPLGYKS